MQRLPLALASALSLAAFVPAQSGVAWIDQDAGQTGLQKYKLSDYFTRIPGTGGAKSMGDITSPAPIWTATSTTAALMQVSMGKSGIAGLAPGEFHMCLTTTNLSSAYTSVTGGQKVFMGKVTWNSGTPVFTPNMMANSMNAAGNCFGLMIDGKDGKVAAVDWPTGPVVSYRANNSLAFPTPVAVSGIGSRYVDPAPAYVNGELVLFWVDAAGSIVYAPLDLTMTGGNLTAAAVDTTKLVTVVAISGRLSHSPTPMVDSSGNCLGMWFASRIGNNSDMYFTANIHNSDSLAEWDNGTAWVNNGGVAGGHFLACSNVADGFYGRLLEGQGYYLVSNSEITVGPSASLTLAAGGPSDNSTGIVTSIVAMSSGVAAPIQLPGALGALGLNPAILFYPVPPGITSTNKDDLGDMTLPATQTSLKGVSISFQALMSPLAPMLPALSSTCTATFQ